MKKIIILLVGLLIVSTIISFFIGKYFGKYDYSKSLIAIKHIDGKYGEYFYAVEVTGKDENGSVNVSAKIFIGSFDNNYYHDCGNIGFGENWTDAKKQFGDVQYDGKGISIGSYRIERSQYENHR